MTFAPQHGCDSIGDRVRTSFDGISDGIALKDCPETQGVRDFFNEASIDPPVQSNDGHQLPSMIFGIADGIYAA
ncbi:hypothetical protein [Burkholderia pyrrocinia]|uniref:hypothetical protein n=1 Tax=Burkholderia pyrrocinia TaxID=60550 RepID=UPI0030CE1352|nr:hypothetical protein [Burkholderia cepacia]